MLWEFLEANRAELIGRCRAKVATRAAPRATHEEMEYGIPLFLSQLIDTLKSEKPVVTSGRPGPLRLVQAGVSSDLATSAGHHGRELLQHGFTVSQVVHDYGDLCQAATELAAETGTEISAANFNTFNRCLDQAIADAVTAYADRRDEITAHRGDHEASERLGMLAHELRNSLNTAMLAFAAIRGGNVAINGATASVLDRSLIALRDLIDRSLTEVRLAEGLQTLTEAIDVDRFIADLEVGATLEAKARGCELSVVWAEPNMVVEADRHLLYSAVSNLLQNAFKYSRPRGAVTLRACARNGHVLIEVEDQCGGLAPGTAESMFRPFTQQHADRSGLGLGLTIARRAVETIGGTLSVRNLPGVGCVFTVALPRSGDLASRAS